MCVLAAPGTQDLHFVCLEVFRCWFCLKEAFGCSTRRSFWSTVPTHATHVPRCTERPVHNRGPRCWRCGAKHCSSGNNSQKYALVFLPAPRCSSELNSSAGLPPFLCCCLGRGHGNFLWWGDSIVVRGWGPFAEDNWTKLRVGGINMRTPKPCSRCKIPTINQTTLEVLQEPRKTLNTFRQVFCFVFARTGPSRLVGRFRSVLRFRGTSGGVFRALLVFRRHRLVAYSVEWLVSGVVLRASASCMCMVLYS